MDAFLKALAERIRQEQMTVEDVPEPMKEAVEAELSVN